VVESLGRQIAKRRAELGWTQQDLAERVAVSRVALSHIETGLTVPGERTVALLAGVFGMEPHELVRGTDYPVGKADRLPVVVSRYTEVELQVVLLDRDLEEADPVRLRAWAPRIADLRTRTVDRRQLELLDKAEHRRRAALRN
jgi:transcriptional regulator with XRE-family HTH domain